MTLLTVATKLKMESVSHRGHFLEVVELVGPELLTGRLREIGLRRNSRIIYWGRAPFGGPLHIQIENSFWALRANEAACIIINESSATEKSEKYHD